MRVLLFGLVISVSVFGSTAYLSVDFQNTADTTQTGFLQFSGAASQTGVTSETFSTVNGNVTVTVDAQIDSSDLGGGYFDRGGLTNSGAFTYASLYNSFTYNNSSATFSTSATTSLSLTLSGPGISALTSYNLTFYTFDPDTGRSATGTHTTTIWCPGRPMAPMR
jgi:hypothetical protein